MASRSCEETLSPFVYWGQDGQSLYLRVDLRDAQDVEVRLSGDDLHFSAVGVGVRGRNQYGFGFDFYYPVEAENSKYRVTDRHIEFQIIKEASGEIWPRLTVAQKKPEWLKIDFDKFLAEDDSDDNSKQPELEEFSKEQELWKSLEKDLDKTQMQATSEITSLWLFIYNLFQWVGFSYIFGMILWKYVTEGPESKARVVEYVGTQMMVCQLVALLEVIHPLLGLVKTGVLSPLMQVFGRNFVLFMIILSEEKLHSSHSVWWLFAAWSSIELVRYPYYMLSSINTDVSIVTWLRYTLFIPMYPLGFLLETLVLLEAIPLYETSGRWTLDLPNAYNMSFPFPYFIRIYISIFLFGGFHLMKHMFRQRQKRLGTSKSKIS